MKSAKDYEQLYIQNGFLWNNYLSDFVQEYGGKEIEYPDFRTGSSETANFCWPSLINVGRHYPQHELTAKYFGEEFAPVGDCNRKHIELLLLESGRLVGFADYLLLTWGENSYDWRSSVKSLLAGVEPVKIGLID